MLRLTHVSNFSSFQRSKRAVKNSIAVLLVSLLTPVISHANGWLVAYTGEGNSGHIVPIKTDDIAIEKEELNIEYFLDHSIVRVKYHLKNYGDAQAIQYGFPIVAAVQTYHEYERPDEIRRAKINKPRRYMIKVDGNEVPSIEKEERNFPFKKPEWAKEIEGWNPEIWGLIGRLRLAIYYISEIPFAKGQERTIEIYCEQDHFVWGSWFSKGNGDIENVQFHYLLSPGGSWRGGKIKDCQVTVRFREDTYKLVRENISPHGFITKSNSIVWNYRNLNPSDGSYDIAIYYEPKLSYEASDVTFYSDFRPRDSSNYTSGEDDPEQYPDQWRQVLKMKYKEHKKIRPRARGITWGASSIFKEPLAPKLQENYSFYKQFRYSPERLSDAALYTAWCEGVKGNGIAEWIKATFRKPRKVSSICILPGYLKNPKLFVANARPKRVKLEFSSGDVFEYEIPVRDYYFYYDAPCNWDWFKLPKSIECRWVKVSILDVVPGTKYTDTCISEILFMETGQP